MIITPSFNFQKHPECPFIRREHLRDRSGISPAISLLSPRNPNPANLTESFCFWNPQSHKRLQEWLGVETILISSKSFNGAPSVDSRWKLASQSIILSSIYLYMRELWMKLLSYICIYICINIWQPCYLNTAFCVPRDMLDIKSFRPAKISFSFKKGNTWKTGKFFIHSSVDCPRK